MYTMVNNNIVDILVNKCSGFMKKMDKPAKNVAKIILVGLINSKSNSLLILVFLNNIMNKKIYVMLVAIAAPIAELRE